MSEVKPDKPTALDVVDIAHTQAATATISADTSSAATPDPATTPRETGGQTGPDPTRYGDWERGGRCIDF
ncbi:MAG: DUF1674 domain-containing protein [Gammaproteobacteria bacterium]